MPSAARMGASETASRFQRLISTDRILCCCSEAAAAAGAAAAAAGPVPVPVEVEGFRRATAVAAGGGHTLAVEAPLSGSGSVPIVCADLKSGAADSAFSKTRGKFRRVFLLIRPLCA
jgi:hypothetical protein